MRKAINSASNVSYIFYKLLKYINRANKQLDENKELPKTIRNEYMQSFCSEVLNVLNIETHCQKIPKVNKPSIFVGNHLSYLDIPLLLKYYPAIFVAKSEVGKWPIIGAAGKLTKTILVKRSNANSRKDAAKQIAEKIRKQQDSIAIFPAGTTSLLRKNHNGEEAPFVFHKTTIYQSSPLEYAISLFGKLHLLAMITCCHTFMKLQNENVFKHILSLKKQEALKILTNKCEKFRLGPKNLYPIKIFFFHHDLPLLQPLCSEVENGFL